MEWKREKKIGEGESSMTVVTFWSLNFDVNIF